MPKCRHGGLAHSVEPSEPSNLSIYGSALLPMLSNESFGLAKQQALCGMTTLFSTASDSFRSTYYNSCPHIVNHLEVISDVNWHFHRLFHNCHLTVDTSYLCFQLWPRILEHSKPTLLVSVHQLPVQPSSGHKTGAAKLQGCQP